MLQKEDYVLFGVMALWGDCTLLELQKFLLDLAVDTDTYQVWERLCYWKIQGLVQHIREGGEVYFQLTCFPIGHPEYLVFYGITGRAFAYDRSGKELKHISAKLPPLPE